MKDLLQEKLYLALQKTFPKINIEKNNLEIQNTSNPSHGDLYCNVAMQLAKSLKDNPINIAEMIVANIVKTKEVKQIKIAPPGYINFYLNKTNKAEIITKINNNKINIISKNEKKQVHIEYVSANPTGPLHVGHGRGMIIGDITRKFLTLQGHNVFNEYYVNDAGRQIDLLLVSVLLNHHNVDHHQYIDEKNDTEGKLLTYRGSYIKDISSKLENIMSSFESKKIMNLLNKPIDHTISYLKQHKDYLISRKKLVDHILDEYIKKDLKSVGISFDNWFYESSLYTSGLLDKVLKDIDNRNLSYEKDGALWFKNTKFGEEKDRVLKKSNGDMTYFATDIAYHIHKFNNYELLIDIWGADHHDYAVRLKTALSSLDYDVNNRLQIHLVQFANLVKSGESLSMSTRSGEFYAIDELVKEVGADATRYFYLIKRKEHHLEFDIDAALNQNKNNPIYYIQYAHARINKILKDSPEFNISDTDLSKLNSYQEKELIDHITNYSEVFENAITKIRPDIIANYLYKLSQLFHSYYSETKILTDTVHGERLELIKCIDKVILNGLEILEIKAMDRM